jgi:hypothetical protein
MFTMAALTYSINLGDKEHFGILDQEIYLNDNPKDKDEEIKKKLKEYISKINDNIPDVPSEKGIDIPLPGNAYLSSDNEPNFESNVADIKQFYNRFDNLNETDLNSTLKKYSGNDINMNLQKPLLNTNLDVNNTLNNNQDKQDIRETTNYPPYWEYNNELPMNGGNMNGIVGYDDGNSLYADYSLTTSLINLTTKSGETPKENVPRNDLRLPAVYN